MLPVRWSDTAEVAELAGYLRAIRPHLTELIVVDGSPDPVFEALDGGVARGHDPRQARPVAQAA